MRLLVEGVSVAANQSFEVGVVVGKEWVWSLITEVNVVTNH